MGDDIVTRLRDYSARGAVFATNDMCWEAADEIERLRAAIDAFIAEVDGDHQPEWASEQAKASGKTPWCCEWCGTQDGGWPCCHRMALDGLKEARRG